MTACLYIFSGLPGVGKTTLGQRLATKMGAAYVRIDTIEQALRDLCGIEVHGEGYGLAHRMAADNLRLGVSVVADSCNLIELTRNGWEDVALNNGARYINIEIICSDKVEHQRRVESRGSTVSGLKHVSWADVERRECDAWTRDRVVIDTYGESADGAFELLCEAIASSR